MNNTDKWNNRYASEEYVFGKEPNDFFKYEIEQLVPGKILFVGDGEGRNSVYAAKLGWEVESIDISETAKLKAEKLAEENNVEIAYFIADGLMYDYPKDYYDAVVIIYFHVDRYLRETFDRKIVKSLKPNGTVILLVYEDEHIMNGSDGPTDPDLLYSMSDIAENYIELEFKVFKKEHILKIKKGIKQKSTVIKFVGAKI